MRGETRRKARRRYPADEALRRVSPRRRRERRRRERERGRATEHRAELDQRCQARLCFGPLNRRKTRSVLRGEAEGRAESPQKQGFGTKPQFRRAEPGGTFLSAADSTGPRPDGVYVYAKRPRGRRSCPLRKASTVARNKAARCQANQPSTGSTIAPTVTAYGKANQRSTIAATRPPGGRCGGGRGSHRSRAYAPRDRRRPCRRSGRNRR